MTVLVSLNCETGEMRRYVYTRTLKRPVLTHRCSFDDWECVQLGLMYLPPETVTQFRVSPPKEFAVCQ